MCFDNISLLFARRSMFGLVDVVFLRFANGQGVRNGEAGRLGRKRKRKRAAEEVFTSSRT